MAFCETHLCNELAVTILRSFLFLPLFKTTSQKPFQFDTHFYFSPLVKFMSCDSLQWSAMFFFNDLGVFFVTWVNILSNMLILIVVMETIKTNHKSFQVVLHWYSYMPQQNDNHLRMIIMLQWHIAVSCDQVIA